MERRKSEKNLKSFAVSFLTLALVLTTVLLPVGGVNTQNVAYAATEGKVTLETTLKTLDETTSDKVELTISVKENATEGVSGIQFNVSYPKEFDLIKKTVGAYFDNGVSFFGPFKGEPNVTETARPMFCGFGSHGTDADKREFTDKESGKLVTLVFEANQQLTQGKSYEFSILDDRLTAFLLKTNEDAQPETKYLTIDKGAVQTYTPKNAGGTITENTKITQAIDEKGNAAVKQQVIAAAAEKGDPIIDIQTSDVSKTNKAQLEISKAAMGIVAENQRNLTIQTDAGQLKFDKDAAASIKAKTDEGKLVINVEKDEDIKDIENVKNAATSFDVTAKLVNSANEETQITEFGGGEVEVSLDLPASLRGEGKEIQCWNYTDTNYTPVEGTVKNNQFVFKTKHFSKYIVAEKTTLDAFKAAKKLSEGVTVSGTVTSWNGEDNAIYLLYTAEIDDAVIKTNIKTGQPEKALSYTATKENIAQNAKQYTQNYAFTGIPEGTYKLAIFKPGGYATYIESITVGSESLEKNVQLSLLGDVNTDGVITAGDLTTLARHIAKIQSISSQEALQSADVTGDGSISAGDLTKLARYIAKIISSLE